MTAPAPPVSPPGARAVPDHGPTDPVDPPAVRPRTRLSPEARREQIISAADSLFHGRDPSDVTFEEIAERAGVSRALVYNYFGDKGGLIAAVYLRSFERLDVRLAEAFRETTAGDDRLRAIIGCYLDFAEADAGCCRLISLAEATEHPLVQGARRRRYDRMAAGWGSSPEARLVARGILALLEGVVLQWLDDPACSRERAEEVLFAMLWSGLAGMSRGGVALPPLPG